MGLFCYCDTEFSDPRSPMNSFPHVSGNPDYRHRQYQHPKHCGYRHSDHMCGLDNNPNISFCI